MQHLLALAKRDADAVRDLRDYVIDAFAEADAVLVVDETGDLRRATSRSGCSGKYIGTAGRIENAQVAVFLTYAACRGHALIDRALYLPKSWTNDTERCRAAGVPDTVQFATKPALATAMITRALHAGVPPSGSPGDEVYGADPLLRQAIRDHHLGYALQVAANRRVHTQAGPMRVDALAATMPEPVWRRTRAGRAAKDPATTTGPGSRCSPNTTTNPTATITC